MESEWEGDSERGRWKKGGQSLNAELIRTVVAEKRGAESKYKHRKKNGTNIPIRTIPKIYLLTTLRLIVPTTASASLLIFFTNFLDFYTTAI